MPTIATAQDSAPETAPEAAAEEEYVGIAEIVVTAQKREENLQDTPISIVALGSDALDQKGIGSMADLMTGAIPSFRIQPFVGRAASVQIGIRGMVPSDPAQITRDMTVGVYLDGVFLGRPQGMGMELADVERIEVLRGPQGTLFGRNALGGAVNLISKKPTGEFGLDAKAGYGNLDLFSAAAHLNLPSVQNISVKLDGVYEKRDGWTKNTLRSTDFTAPYVVDNKSYSYKDVSHDWSEIYRYGVRASALWEPTSTLSVLYAFDWSRDKSTGGYWHITDSGQTFPTFFGELDDGRAKEGRIGVPLMPSTAKVHGHSVTAEWQFTDDLMLRSISGWRGLSQDQWDADAGALGVYRPSGSIGRLSYSNVKQSQFSEELQLVGEVGDFQFVFGGYYFHEKARDIATVFTSASFDATMSGITLRNPATSRPVPDREGRMEAESKALFGQFTWTPEMLDYKFHLTAGGRYTDDTKDGTIYLLGGAPSTLAFDFSSKRFDPMVTLAYDITDDINVYAKYGQAYRAGGANFRSSILRSFAEEELKSWEAGFKADFFDRRARFNLAAYTSKLKSPQIDFADPTNVSATETLNADTSIKVKGIETDLTVVPVRGLNLSANFTYTDVSQAEMLNPFTNMNEFVHIAMTPKTAFSASADYTFPDTPLGLLRAYVDVNEVGGVYSHPSPALDSTRSSKTLLVNGRLTLSEIPVAYGDLELALWGKNITNRTYDQYDSTFASPISNRAVFYNEPRTYGVEARVRF